MGAFLGYKWIHSSGLTLDAQGGVEYLTAKAESSSATAEDSTVIPLLNLNAGWSF